MRSVEADDVIPEKQLWRSPKRVAINLGILIVVWGVIFLAPSLLHLSFGASVALGATIAAVAIAVDVLRYRLKRRA